MSTALSKKGTYGKFEISQQQHTKLAEEQSEVRVHLVGLAPVINGFQKGSPKILEMK